MKYYSTDYSDHVNLNRNFAQTQTADNCYLRYYVVIADLHLIVAYYTLSDNHCHSRNMVHQIDNPRDSDNIADYASPMMVAHIHFEVLSMGHLLHCNRMNSVTSSHPNVIVAVFDSNSSRDVRHSFDGNWSNSLDHIYYNYCMSY